MPNTYYVDRAEDDKIIGAYKRPQRENHESVEDTDPDLIAFLNDYSDAIKQIRDKKIGAGIDVGGVEVGTDDQTQARMIAVRIKAQEDENYTVNWKTKNGFVQLNAATIIAVSDAIHDHVQACFTAESNVDLSSVTSLEDLAEKFEAAYAAATA